MRRASTHHRRRRSVDYEQDGRALRTYQDITDELRRRGVCDVSDAMVWLLCKSAERKIKAALRDWVVNA